MDFFKPIFRGWIRLPSILRFLIVVIVLNLFYYIFSLIVAEFSTLNIDISVNGFFAIHQRNDSWFYKLIFEEGYSNINNINQFLRHHSNTYGMSEWAFFPAYPSLVKGINLMTGWNWYPSAFIISVVFSVLFLFLLYKSAIILFGLEKEKANYVTLFFAVFPVHYHYFMYYTEPIFLTFLLAGFLLLHSKRYILFSIILIPLVLLRPNGIISLLPLYIFLLEREGIITYRKFSVNFKAVNWQIIFKTLYFFSGIFSFLAYLVYQYEKTGFYLAFTKAQAGWDREAMFPLLALFQDNNLSTYFNSFYAVFMIIMGYFMIKKYPISHNALFWITLVMPLIAGSSVSIPRYMSIVFPLFIFIFQALYKYKFKYLLIVFSLFLQLLIFYFWLLGNQLSY